MRAFGAREEQELKGLDPNSEEALKKCKYLRRKEVTEDSWDLPSHRKTSRRKDKQSSRRQGAKGDPKSHRDRKHDGDQKSHRDKKHDSKR